jgi:dual specificity phosphatase 12
MSDAIITLQGINDIHCVDRNDEDRKSLFLTSFEGIRDIEKLKELNITRIMSICRQPYSSKYIKECASNNITISFFPIEDDPKELKLLATLNDTARMIESELKDNGKVLVHCQAGVSRSATVILGWWLYTDNTLTVDNALKLLQEKRSCVKPNYGFIDKLEIYRQHIISKSSVIV